MQEDYSVLTFKGHKVQKELIQCDFSPLE